MKRIVALFLGLSLTAIMAFTAVAAEVTKVYVTISDGSGKAILVQEEITVTDIDADNMLTVNDALYNAHEEYCQDGANGYAFSETEYGLSLNKLWGIENGGSYGYYVNNAMAMSLSDEIKTGDSIYAYVYSDTIGYSDTYSYFEKSNYEAKCGEKIQLTLYYIGFDENWNAVSLPLANATVTVDGKETEVFTDENGKAEITFEKDGSFVLSAVSDELTLVPPVCQVKVIKADVSYETEQPDMGVKGVAVYAVMILCAGGILFVLRNNAKEN